MDPTPLARLQEGYDALRPASWDKGHVKRLALRPSTNERQLVEVMRVTRAGGIEGDRWAKGAKRSPDNQITLMREDVARLLCPDDQIEIFGDNIFADVDLHADLLRVGSVLRIGSASLQVSPEPHDGCSKFKRRSVAGGLEFISQPSKNTASAASTFLSWSPVNSVWGTRSWWSGRPGSSRPALSTLLWTRAADYARLPAASSPSSTSARPESRIIFRVICMAFSIE
jgi:hypothetical protein